MRLLDGKVVLVTGGAREQGRAHAATGMTVPVDAGHLLLTGCDQTSVR